MVFIPWYQTTTPTAVAAARLRLEAILAEARQQAGVVDACFADPRLAAIYDHLDDDRSDLEPGPPSPGRRVGHRLLGGW